MSPGEGEVRNIQARTKQSIMYIYIIVMVKSCSGSQEVRYLQEIKEQDNTISEKEKRIYDLKKKNQELEKFKFVLDHKIKELKKQIEPKEEEIADMKDQIKACVNWNILKTGIACA